MDGGPVLEQQKMIAVVDVYFDLWSKFLKNEMAFLKEKAIPEWENEKQNGILALESHEDNKPGIWANVVSLGQVFKAWQTQWDTIARSITEAESHLVILENRLSHGDYDEGIFKSVQYDVEHDIEHPGLAEQYRAARLYLMTDDVPVGSTGMDIERRYQAVRKILVNYEKGCFEHLPSTETVAASVEKTFQEYFPKLMAARKEQSLSEYREAEKTRLNKVEKVEAVDHIHAVTL